MIMDSTWAPVCFILIEELMQMFGKGEEDFDDKD